MSEGYEFAYNYTTNTTPTKVSFEKKLEKCKHRMELIRTVIGVVVLGIQIVIVYHLLKN